MSIFDIFKKLDEEKAAKASQPIEWIVVGLGTPGATYDNTRHNAGFRALEGYCARSGQKIDRMKFKALAGEGMLGGKRVLFLKPQTFMNLSGEAVRDAASFYKIPPEHVIVLSDDVSLDVGTLRVRAKGSAGGQNGLKNIIYHLNSEDFPRVKIGVGKKPRPDYDLAAWVLGKFPAEDQKAIDKACEDAVNELPASSRRTVPLPRRNSTENASKELVLMKTAVAYYSLGGTTRSYARAEAKARNADLIELTPKTPYNRFTAFVRGCLEAVKQKAVALDGMPLFVGYDRVVLMAPVWAGYPAPPFNSAVELLPPGTEVEVILVSGSGNSEKSRAKVRLQIKKRGCTLTAQRDIRASR